MSFQNDRITSIPAPLPLDYDRQYSFSNWETNNPGVSYPASGLEAEFNAIQQAVDETQARMRLIQDDDGSLRNASVGNDQLKSEVLIGVNAPTNWATTTSYAVSDTVFQSNIWYYCLEAHVSDPSSFATDLGAGKWRELLDLTTVITVEAQNWANYPEDSLVPEGDLVDDYSALHHANKAAASAAAAAVSEANAAADAAVVPDPSGGSANDLLRRNGAGTEYELFTPTAEATAATAGTLALRDGSGRTKVAAPSVDADAVNKGFAFVSSTATYQIGSGQDYATLTAALQDLAHKQPIYAAAGVRVTLNIATTEVLAEQILIDGLDLSWITITGTDATTTVTRSALSTAKVDSGGNTHYPVFAGDNGAKMPVISQKFVMDTSGTATSRVGFLVDRGSLLVVSSGAGMTSCAAEAVVMEGQSTLVALSADFSNAGGTVVDVDGGSSASLQGSDLSGGPGYGLRVVTGSSADAGGIDVSGCNVGVFVSAGSKAWIAGADATGCTQYGVDCQQASLCDAISVDTTGAGTTGFRVVSGGIINASGATGTLSVTANTVTAAGIIFQ